MKNTIYKICPETAWDAAVVAGIYEGSQDDKRDGFIHFSTKGQVKATLAKHFSRQAGLLLLAIDVSLLNPSELKYEDNGKGEKFPHLYGKLSLSVVQACCPIRMTAAREHIIDF